MTNANETVVQGTRFEVLGRNFYNWPGELVLGFNESPVVSSQVGSGLMKLVGRTSTKLIFEVVEHDIQYGVNHTWNVFGTPFEPTREVLSYDTI